LLICPPFFNGHYVIFNTVIGRVKEEKLHRDPRVSVSDIDLDNPRPIELRGRVTRLSEATMAV
jgi:hypothetical protein